MRRSRGYRHRRWPRSSTPRHRRVALRRGESCRLPRLSLPERRRSARSVYVRRRDCLGARVAGARSHHLLADLLGQRDGDALRAAQVTEAVHVLVLHHLAEELGAVLAQPRDDVVDVVDGEHDATYAQRVGRCVLRFGADRLRPLKLRQLEPAVAVRGPHHDDVGSDALQPEDAVHPGPLDRRLALHFQAKLGKEGDGRCEVFENNAHVVHAPKSHGPEHKTESGRPATRPLTVRSTGAVPNYLRPGKNPFRPRWILRRSRPRYVCLRREGVTEMSKRYDAIVMGARCAGSPTAMLLARKGYRVLVVDRSTFPSDTVSTHVLQPMAVAALARWGLLERLTATGCPPVHTFMFDFGPVRITGAPGTEA